MSDIEQTPTEEDDIPEAYSQQEINLAREALKTFTPEEYLTLQDELARALSNQSLPEAVAICFTEVYTPLGNKVNITCRGMTGKNALDELADALRHAREKYGMHQERLALPAAPSGASTLTSNEPHYVPDENPDAGQAASQPSSTATKGNLTLVDIIVTSIARERKRDGKGDFLRVKGGMFTKYGAPAYDNNLPKTFDITKLQYGVEVAPTPDLAQARVQAEVDGAGKMSKARVVQFFQ